MSDARKKQQWLVFALIGGGILVGIIVLGQIMNSRKAAFQGVGAADRVDETIIADRTSNASPELTWTRQAREDIDKLTKTVQELTESVTTLTEKQKSDFAAMQAEYDDAIVKQQQEIEALKSGTAAAPGRPVPEGAVLGPNGENYGQEFIGGGGRSPVAGQPAAGGNPGASAPGQISVQQFGGGSAIDFGLSPKEDAAEPPADEQSSNIKDLKSYVPAGSYAPAVIISGVDASTGVVSRDNPVPVLARITGAAVTAAPGSGSARKVNLQGCTVLGSAMGDLSSERVYVRLTTLTCMGKNNQVIETEVAGLVAGSGKAGVRGHVVSREGGLAMNAAISGALGGFADAVSSAASIASSNDEAQSVGSVLNGAGAGMVGGGAGNAADRLAEYYIKRAEQYQPVVSLYAGTEVEVVFMEGVSLK
ncbi:MAG: putative conjugative transfer factor, TraB [Verrucomicrobiota bacterium]|jgi:conjugal transfer pilus assembly protein TraB